MVQTMRRAALKSTEQRGIVLSFFLSFKLFVVIDALVCNPPFPLPEERERKQNEAVIKLQTLWRGYRESQRFNCLHAAVVVTPPSISYFTPL